MYWTNAQMIMCWKLTWLVIYGCGTEYTPPKTSTQSAGKLNTHYRSMQDIPAGEPSSCNHEHVHDMSIITDYVYQTCSVQVKKAANNISITEERDVHL